MKLNEFITYMLGFYGDVKDSLGYFKDRGFPPMQVHEIKAVIPLVQQVYPSEFEQDGTLSNGDSLMREITRDFVLHGRGYDIVTEHHTCEEAIRVWNENKDAWRKEYKQMQQDLPVTGADLQRRWEFITREADIKPKWFGFLSN